MAGLDYRPPFRKAERPFGVPNILILGAGPCTVSARVLHAMSAQTLQVQDLTLDKVSLENKK